MGSDTQAKFSYTTFVTLDNILDPSGVYGQTVAISTANLEAGAPSPVGVYGQVVPISTASVEPPGVYGQTVAISGFGSNIGLSNVSGVGDIIYYGDAGDLDVTDATILGQINTDVLVSGLTTPSSSYSGLSNLSSNSMVFSEASAVAELPAGATKGVYLYFSNYNGLTFSVSGVNDIVTSLGANSSVSISGVGSHLGVIGDGTRWIAVEEGGIA